MTTNTTTPPTRVGIAYVEARFSKHRNTIRRWISSGKFPKPEFDPSGYRSWSLDDLDAWEAENYPDTNPDTKNAAAALAARMTPTCL